jgi:penicillin amidase
VLAEASAAAANKADEVVGRSDMRQLCLTRPFGLTPSVGGCYHIENVPVGGSTDSLMMTAHGSTVEHHFVRYGYGTRHIYDLSNDDADWVVLLGSQDGCTNFADQVALWQSGDYVQLPPRLDSVRRRLLHILQLSH